MISGDFKALARGLSRIGSVCDESCGHGHDAHGCEHVGHACGCPHSESYDFDWELSSELVEHWSDSAMAALLRFLSRLPGGLAADEVEAPGSSGGGAERTACCAARWRVHIAVFANAAAACWLIE